jgi:hypothetical protein
MGAFGAVRRLCPALSPHGTSHMYWPSTLRIYVPRKRARAEGWLDGYRSGIRQPR